MAVYNFGSINIDHIYSLPHFVAPGETLACSSYNSVLGGKGANQSIACALAGMQTHHIGAINSNDRDILNQLQDAGVDCSGVVQGATPSGHAIIQVNQDGENSIVLFAGANHQLSTEQINQTLANTNNNDWVLLQNETNAIDQIIDLAHAKGLKVAFNPAPMTPSVANLPLDKVSLLFVNEIEAMQLSNTNDIDAAIAALSNSYPNTELLITLGKQGVLYMHKGERISVKGFKVEAVDTTAAGDTFTGYFVANYAALPAPNAQNIRKALQTACAAAALCVTKHGAAPSIPDQQAVQSLLTAHNI